MTVPDGRSGDGDRNGPDALLILGRDQHSILPPVAIASSPPQAEADPGGEEELARLGSLRRERTVGLVVAVLVHDAERHGRGDVAVVVDIAGDRDGTNARDPHR